MNKTRNDLPLKVRQKIAALCNARLADATDLMLQAKVAHWNVKGVNFIALHELFDKVYDAAGEAVDEIAERCVALGGQAMGTVRTAARESNLKEYPATISQWKDHVAALSDRIATFGKLVREAIDAADEAGDADTADLFTGISRSMDKMLWFVESHLAD